jgi:plasminogen activator inhibitor 1 RNA-binding protein
LLIHLARDARNNNTSRGGFGRGGSGRGDGRGGSGRPREFRSDDSNGFTDRAPAAAREEGGDANKSGEAQHQPYRGPRRGGYREGDYSRPRRAYERHSGTGHGNEVPRQGSGRGNWGTFTDEPVPQLRLF